MRKSLLAVVAFALLTGCGTHAGPMATTLAGTALAARAVDADKSAIPMPNPMPVRQGFTANDAASIANQAYTQAFAAKKPEDVQKIAATALDKIVALLPDSTLAKQVVPYAKAVLGTKVADAENQRRVALWPLWYIAKGVTTSDDPAFFEMSTKVMESMVNWKDGLTVGLATLDFLKDAPNGYVKTMVEKAFAAYRDPKNDMQASYKEMVNTFKDISTTLKAVKK